MRVSEYYDLDKDQPVLEFIDVDISDDTLLFIDPRALKYIDSEWGQWCVSLVQNYFQNVLNKIRSGEHDEAKRLLSVLSEPNETHLGYSTGRSNGRGMGKEKALLLWTQLRNSRAVATGLVSDLEETTLFIENINLDTVSDITTGIIREPLVKFTQDMCDYYGIPKIQNVGLNRTWNPRQRKWESKSFDLPITSDGVLLLVPKSVVRRKPIFNPDEYYRYYIAPFLQEEELNAGSSLVETFQNGRRRVTKKAVREKYVENPHRAEKEVNLSTTVRKEDILEQYRQAKSSPENPLGHTQLAAATNTDMPDFQGLLNRVLRVPRGRDAADDYHVKAEELLTALFYPSMDYPSKETRIHGGRKKIDITYTNVSASGFFWDLTDSEQIALNRLAVECKNYSEDVANPELDQLAGRFNPNAGFFGILVSREVSDRALMNERCRDAVRDERGFMLVLDDNDLRALVEEKLRNPDSVEFRHLRLRFNEIIS